MRADSATTSLDLRGLACPLPALRTAKALRKLNGGDLLIVECTDPLASIDIPHLLNETGDALERQDRRDDALIFHIRRKRP
ncbi:SirA family protein [Methylocella silvestris BL2]|uniref:SirA family protein n=1 Tax=Methylocella silvestris (strain DSM 15510 / CIP 108128 / LMG 27833 / NCIMB 13906 / BL2) TaxID=395965 RepID=B8EK00_METSB|nr:sulfurtransferase TusA family protein [Methylocella silvestris]ACK49947.1 SirA family protein [Methylocella silvestris BL2]